MAGKSKPRKWQMDQALHSVRSMMKVLPDLTMAEIEAALVIESASRRRGVILDRLIGRAAELARQSTTKQLTERFVCPVHKAP